MLVYGDHDEDLDPFIRLAQLETDRRRLIAMPPGLARHRALTALFLALAGVAQGVADADFALAGEDRIRPAEAALLSSLMEVARALIASWESDFETLKSISPLASPPDLPASISVRLPEGYAFYALYPESFALAADQLQLTASARVIGLRSIGSGLACMAAAALGAPPPFTLRPGGHPFARTLSIAPQLAEQLLAGDPHFVVVDEGPGLSGSSFGAVLDWLEANGVPRDRIAVLPGHTGALGPQASTEHRARWDQLRRSVVTSDELLHGRLKQWVGDLVGSLLGEMQDISGGAWRALLLNDERTWPPVNPTWERRKFLARSASGLWQVRFAGLGRIGEAKLRIARHLHAVGFGPEAAGLAHGWLVLRWHEDASPTRPTIAELAHYLECRAELPTSTGEATLEDLAAMSRHNLPNLLGQWFPDATNLQSRSRPACIDGRMAPHEWLRLADGSLLKSDALDHHQAHDLVGTQDLAWDIAGATLELDLSAHDTASLVEAIDADPELTDFHLRAYAAFRTGALRLTAQMLPNWPAEAARNLARADLLETRLRARL